MSLIRAERRRFFKRRLTIWMLVIGGVILGAILSGVALTHQKPTPAVLAAAEARAEAEYQRVLQDFEVFKARCPEDPHRPPEMKCEDMTPPQRDWFSAEQFMPAQFEFKKQFGETVMVWAAIVAMIAFVLGATFVGAEWNSGAMMNLLTWRPRRMGVLGTKLGVLLGVMAGVGVVTFGLWTAALYGIGEIAGNTDGMTAGTWQSFGLYGLRGVAMILAFGALGFGLASLGRHTALALGVAVAVIVVGQIGLAMVLDLANVPYMEQYLIPVHMYTWINKEVILEDWSQPVACGPLGCDEPPKLILQFADTGWMAFAVLAVLTVAAFWSMQRRDVA